MKNGIIGKRIEFNLPNNTNNCTLQGVVIDKVRDDLGVDFYLVELDNSQIKSVYPYQIIRTA